MPQGVGHVRKQLRQGWVENSLPHTTHDRRALICLDVRAQCKNTEAELELGCGSPTLVHDVTLWKPINLDLEGVCVCARVFFYTSQETYLYTYTYIYIYIYIYMKRESIHIAFFLECCILILDKDDPCAGVKRALALRSVSVPFWTPGRG